MRRIAPLVLACACSHPKAVTPSQKPSPPSTACASPEHRQLDFWIGDWDVHVRARSAPDKDEWGEAKGTQHVESILGGCAISENFVAEGPQQPWAGKSYSMWQAKLGKWRQTWVDDSGGFLPFTGGVEAGVMTLYQEHPTADKFQMRMVFQNVTPRSLHWEWQRSDDNWATSSVQMTADYTRR